MSDLPFNVVDGVVIALVIMSALFAFFRGFTREVLAVAAWIAAGFVAMYVQDDVKPYALQATGHEILAQAIAVGAPFIVALLVFSILTHIVASRVQQSAVGPLDRTLGFGFGILRGLAAVSIFYLVVTNLVKEPEDPSWMRDAKTLPIIRAGAEIVFDLLPPELRSDQVLSRLRDQGGTVIDGVRTFETIAPVLSPNAPGAPAPSYPPPSPPATPGPQGGLQTPVGETSYSTQQVSDFNRLIDTVGTPKAN